MIPFPDKKYNIIYADPPWKYDFSRSKSREIENQYPTMTTKEICSLKIPAAKDAVLYLWATAPKLIDALEVMKAWEFIYKTHAVWDKEIIGMGYWFRNQHELLLVGTRGDVSPPHECFRVSSIIKQKRAYHSQKPRVIKDLIYSWYPIEPKIELFARERTPGWDVWGNEV